MPRFVVTLAIMTLFVPFHADGADAPPVRPIVVQWCDMERLTGTVTSSARWALTRSFVRIGIPLRILGCDEHDASPSDPFRVTIVVLRPQAPGPGRVPAAALGATFRSAETAPRVVWIYARRVERVARTAAVDRGLVLGHVMAHEVAHVLLPGSAHSGAGLMRATWDKDDLVGAAQGQLRFSPAEVAAMKARLAHPED